MMASKTIFSMTAFATAFIFGGGVLLYMNLGDVAKVLAEKIATQTLGVEVRVGHMDISVPDQRLAIKNLTIMNPPGYDSPFAMRAGEITMQGVSMSKELLAFGTIDVKKTTIYMDVGTDGSNLKTMADHAQKNKSQSAQGEDSANAVKVAIDRVSITDTQLRPAGLLADISADPVTLETITLNKIGTKENAVLASEAVNQIWQQLFKEVMRSSITQNLLSDLSSDILGKVTEGTGIDIRGGALDSIQDIGRDLNEAGKDALKSLFE